MKKIIAILMVMAVLMSGMSVFAASTATSVYNESKSNSVDQYFTTSGVIENGGKDFVTLLVTKSNTITVDNIMYIDQTVAGSDGSFIFEDYIPKINVPVGDKYTVKVGATSLTSAIPGGFLEVPAPAGHPVNGTVSFKGGLSKANLVLSSGDTVITSASSENGEFSLGNIEDGTYTLTVTKRSHLPATVTVTVSGGSVSIPEIVLRAGDCNEDRSINLRDITKLVNVFGKKEVNKNGYDVAVDLNEDGAINLNDITLLLTNFGKKAD